MNNRALTQLERDLATRSAYPYYGYFRDKPTPTSIGKVISPVQFQRLSHDIKMWREAIVEMEDPFYPYRVRAMRMYNDCVENPYVKAVINRQKELTIQRDYNVYQIKNGKKVASQVLSDTLSNQYWFADYLEYILDAQTWGYSLIELGRIENDGFPNITFTRRENIRPDGIGDSGPILTSLVYQIDGIHIKGDDPLIDLCNHWIPTKSNVGISKCGYGLLYGLALLEIHLRHIMEWNMDYVEGFGMPIKKGTTRKTGKERDEFEEFLASAASNSYVLLDSATDDKLEYEMAASAGTAWKSYDNIEKRIQKTMSQLVLGHEDAMQSTAGKLGGQQTSNKDGFNESLIEQAMNAKQITYGNFVERNVNYIGAPRFRKLGEYVGSKVIKELLPEGYYFGFANDKEELEIRRRRNSQNLTESQVLKTLYEAGFKMSAQDASDYTGLKLDETIPQKELIEKRTTTNTNIKTGENGTESNTTDANAS